VRHKPHRATGEPKGRPLGSSVPLRKHRSRLVLGCADTLRWFCGCTNQKAFLGASVYMLKTDDEPILLNELTMKMRRHFERGLTVARRLTLPAKGNPASMKLNNYRLTPVGS
jgi:hypothetical protein